jgi:hypothetical protein
MSVQLKYRYLEQAYPDMLENISALIQRIKLSGRFVNIKLNDSDIEEN